MKNSIILLAFSLALISCKRKSPVTLLEKTYGIADLTAYKSVLLIPAGQCHSCFKLTEDQYHADDSLLIITGLPKGTFSFDPKTIYDLDNKLVSFDFLQLSNTLISIDNRDPGESKIYNEINVDSVLRGGSQ